MNMYICILLLVSLFSFKEYFLKKRKGYFFIFLLLFLCMGLRDYRVGTDLKHYLAAYNYLSSVDTFIWKYKNFEIGYIFFCYLLGKIKINKDFFIFLVSFLSLYPIYLLFKKNSRYPITATFFYLSLGLYFFSFSGLRQTIAIGISCLSFKFIKEKKVIKFFIIILIATLFHKSAVFFLIAYPLYYFKLNFYHYIEIIILSLIFFIYQDKIGIFLYSIIKGRNYIPYKLELGVQWFAIIMFLLFLGIIIIILKNKLYYKYNFYINSYIVFLFIHLMASVGNTVSRVGYYFLPFISILFSEILSEIFNKKIRLFIFTITIICFFIFCIYDIKTSSLNIIPYKIRGDF